MTLEQPIEIEQRRKEQGRSEEESIDEKKQGRRKSRRGVDREIREDDVGVLPVFATGDHDDSLSDRQGSGPLPETSL